MHPMWGGDGVVWQHGRHFLTDNGVRCGRIYRCMNRKATWDDYGMPANCPNFNLLQGANE